MRRSAASSRERPRTNSEGLGSGRRGEEEERGDGEETDSLVVVGAGNGGAALRKARSFAASSTAATALGSFAFCFVVSSALVMAASSMISFGSRYVCPSSVSIDHLAPRAKVREKGVVDESKGEGDNDAGRGGREEKKRGDDDGDDKADDDGGGGDDDAVDDVFDIDKDLAHAETNRRACACFCPRSADANSSIVERVSAERYEKRKARDCYE